MLNNWLCNLTGNDGSWFPMDLMLEHNIRLLKAFSGRRDTPFDATFFKEIVSLNIRYFLGVKESLRTATRLNATGGRHQAKKKTVAMRHLQAAMKEKELHRFRPGRTYGFKAQDDFDIGFDRFASSSRIADFVRRTLADGCDLHDGEDTTADCDESMEERNQTSVPLPNTWQNGELIPGEDSDSDDDVVDGEE